MWRFDKLYDKENTYAKCAETVNPTKRMDFIPRMAFQVLRTLTKALEPCLHFCWIRHSPKADQWDRIAVLLDSGVGDTLMATPMLRELRRQAPNATILAVVDRATRQVLAGNQHIDGMCLFREGGDEGKIIWSSVKSLRRFRPQVILVAQTGNTLKQIFAAYASRAPVRAKHAFQYPPERSYSDFEFLFSHSPSVDDNRHRVLDNLALLETIGLSCKLSQNELEFPIATWERESAHSRLISKGWRPLPITVCLHPGVGTASLKKQWPAGKFAELGSQLVAEHDAQIVLVGGGAEIELCRQIARQIGDRCFVVTGECSLAETGAVIQCSQLFVSNDSGLMHLAAAVRARGVAIFGRTNPVKIGPFGGQFRIVQGADIEAIPVEVVFSRCAELLQELPLERSA